jgi:phage minor structural protein
VQIPKNIQIKNNGKTTAYLSPKADGLKDVYVDCRLNGESILEFMLPATSEKISELTPECEIWAGGRVYILRKDESIDTIRDDKNALWTKVMAVEKWYELDTSYVEPSISNDPTARPPADLAVIIVGGGSNLSGNRYATGTAGHALYAILQGSGWTLGTVDVTGIRDLEAEKVSRLELIKMIQDIWGGYLVFDSINKIIHLRDTGKWQPYNGFQVRYRKNLKHITRTQSNKIITKLYPFGHDDLDIATVNSGKKYITNNSYTSMEYVGIYKNQDIYSQSELKEKAIAELELICRPRYLYKIKLVDVRVLPEYEHEDYKLGDMADIIDPDIAPDSPRPRIIRHKYNLFQPWQCELDIGDPEERLVEQLKASFGTTQFIDGKFKGDGKFSGHSIELGTIGADKIKVNELVVGDNIRMGPNAYISWGNVTNQPNIGQIALDKINATYIDANGVWTPNVYATNINTLRGKIRTAQIETLEVGYNVIMGPNAYISWRQVDDKPRDLAYLDDIPTLPSYIRSTYIDSTRVESPNIIGGTIRGGRIISDSEIDVTTDASIGRNLYMRAGRFNEGIFFNTFSETSITVDDPYGGLLIRGGLIVSGAGTGSFRTADGQTVRVYGGIITEIY